MSGHRDSGLDHDDSPHLLIEYEKLKEENQVLSQQIKQLVKAESRLYGYQQELDAQLKEYKELYELSKKLNATLDIQKIFSYALEYIMHGLEYERAIFFLREEDSSYYRVCALDGYYDEDEKGRVFELAINQSSSLLETYFEGCEHKIFNQEIVDKELNTFSKKIIMSEYVVYALGAHKKIPALLVAGNSADNAEFYRRVGDSDEVLLGMGNLVGMLSSAVENHFSFKMMEKALDQERIAKAKYLGIFENAAEGIIQLTIEGRFTSCNKAAAKILGYNSPEQMPHYLSEIATELMFDNELVKKLLEGLRAGTDIKNLELDFMREEGVKHSILLSTRAVYDEEIITSIDGIILDITERKKAGEELQRAHDQLELRVKERTEELAKTNDLLLDEIIERTRIEEQLRKLSEIDPLTMIYNRRKFFELIGIEVEKCRRYKRPLTLIMYDLDNFKQINDRFGHQTGDHILKSTTVTVCGSIRNVDVFARYGGEEFILLCPETGIEGALILAERIKTSIENHECEGPEKVTISVGVAEFDIYDSVDTFIEKVDKALYAAKEKGRNRVEIADARPAA